MKGKLVSTEIPIQGMTCVMCQGAVTDALKGLHCVIDVSVNHLAYVTYLPGAVTPVEMGKAIEDPGYHYIGKEGEAGRKMRKKEQKDRLFRSILGFSVGVPLMIMIQSGIDIGISMPHFMFYDTTLMLASFLTLGRFLEGRVKGRTTDSIKNWWGSAPGRPW